VFRSRPALALHNHYGPTEATTCATVARVPPDLKGEPSIGCPVAGATVLLLDKAVQPVPDGETGEIYVGGQGLALGYLNRHQLTAERFIVAQDRRLYRTGDLGCWRDGELHFGGRVDQQVKIRGFRIELGEVESALMRLGEVESALAVVNEASGRRQLVAYVQSRQPLTPAAVRQSLAAWLPDYMLPARLVVLSAFPLLASGKVDRNALPQPTEEPVGPDVNSSRMEKPIIHVFEEVLSRASVGPQDSFFDLGGDSLASVQAALRLGEILGYELPPALIHQAPSPRALARALEHGRVHASGHLSLLEPGGVAPPLFCMADLFGHAFNYLNLARRLGEYRPVHGVSPGSLQEAFTRSGDIATLTRGFTADLRAVRPSGPYLIAGYSAGGALAVDLACALEREGEEVRLILLDSCLHSTRPSAALITRWALRHAAGIFERGKLLTQIQRLGSLLGTLRRGLGRDAPPAWIPRSQLAFAAAMIKAGGRYRPGTFAGPTLMVKATEREPIDELADEDGLMGWSGALTGPVVRVTVAGGHHQFLRDPLVAETALAVNRFLLAYD
jgi:thioesterase domain-containing protein/acyl carrier protein